MTIRRAAVRVPCSTSNLGAGFDCVGIALDRWMDATVTAGDSVLPGVTIARRGSLATLGDAAAETDHVVAGFQRACAVAGVAVPNALAFDVRSEIPVARGLGSSAAALVAGALLADALLGLRLAADALVSIVVDVDGHPDNAAPIVFGGAVLAVPACGGAYAVASLDVHPSLAMAIAVPDFETTTRSMRAALPPTIPFRDAAAAAGKAAALVRGLATGDASLLAYALDDVLHVPYRRALLRGYDDVVAAAHEAGAFGASLSGSGSTILAVATHDRAPAVAEAMAGAWRALGVRAEGSVASIAGPAAVA